MKALTLIFVSALSVSAFALADAGLVNGDLIKHTLESESFLYRVKVAGLESAEIIKASIQPQSLAWGMYTVLVTLKSTTDYRTCTIRNEVYTQPQSGAFSSVKRSAVSCK